MGGNHPPNQRSALIKAKEIIGLPTRDGVVDPPPLKSRSPEPINNIDAPGRNRRVDELTSEPRLKCVSEGSHIAWLEHCASPTWDDGFPFRGLIGGIRMADHRNAERHGMNHCQSHPPRRCHDI